MVFCEHAHLCEARCELTSRMTSPWSTRQDPLAPGQGLVGGCQSFTCRFWAAITAELFGFSRLRPSFSSHFSRASPVRPHPFSRKSSSLLAAVDSTCYLLRCFVWRRGSLAAPSAVEDVLRLRLAPLDTYHTADLLPTILSYVQGDIPTCCSFILLICSQS